MDKTEQYLSLAAKCLAEAETAAPEMKATLITIAEQYTRLAEFAARERDAKDGAPPETGSE